MKYEKPFNLYSKLCALYERLKDVNAGLPPDGKKGQFLISDGKDGGEWLTVGIAEEGEY